MRIEVLGEPTARCNRLAENVHEAVRSMGWDDLVVRVADPAEIAARGVWKTPTLVVDGNIEVIDAVPYSEDIAAMLSRIKNLQ